MEVRRLLKDGLHLGLGRVASSLVALLQFMLLARILGAEDFGKYSLILMVVNLVLIVGLNWADASMVRHGREEFVQRGKINVSFWSRMMLFVPVIIVFLFLFWLFRGQLSGYVGVSEALVWLLMLMFILNGVLNALVYMFQSMDQMKKSAYVLLSQKVIFLVMLLLLLLAPLSKGLPVVLVLVNLSFLISIALNFFMFDFSSIRPVSATRAQFGKIWSYSWPQLIGFPGLYLVSYTAPFVINHFLTLEDVGIYSVAYSSITSIFGLLMMVHVVMFPAIVEYRTKGQPEKVTRYLKSIPLLVLIWSGFVVIGLLLSGWLIPLFFSEAYAAAVPSFNILLVTSLFYLGSVCLLPVINAFDLIVYSQFFNLAKAAVNIIADIILVPRIGIAGAAIGALVAYSFGLLLDISLIAFNMKHITLETGNNEATEARPAA